MTPETIPLEAREPGPRQDNQAPSLFGQTPSQTVGPFFHYGLPWKGGADLVGTLELGARADLFPLEHYVLAMPSSTGTPKGEVIEIVGRVLDVEGQPVADALVEIWQANAAGRYASPDDARDDVALDPHFIGFGRSSTDPEGGYRFRTIRPGRVPAPGGGLQAAHVAISLFARGLLNRVVTRLYFEGGEGQDEDPILVLVPSDRRQTLIARPDGEGTWRFDIILGGERETVFFAL
jgi:protocatechuate 3,4-dioxygenase, alpha subunit